MKTVLVTGATGALGIAVTEYINTKDGFELITAARSGVGADVQLDITDKDQLADVVEQVKPGLIMQLAATFTHDFDDAYALNVHANRQLLEAVQNSNFDTRVLLIGSAAEYGVIEPDENPISEDHALNPVSVYGLTKVWQTQLAGFYAKHGPPRVAVPGLFHCRCD